MMALPRTCVFFLLAVVPLWPCSCSAPVWEKDFAESSMVFRGKVSALTKISGAPTGRIIVRFAVLANWKGAAQDFVTMHTELEQAACWGFGPDLVQVGNDLLVFASEQPRDWEAVGEQSRVFPSIRKTCLRRPSVLIPRNGRITFIL